MPLPEHNITGELLDADGNPLQHGTITFVPTATSDARVDGSNAMLGFIVRDIKTLPNPLTITEGGWTITISTKAKRQSGTATRPVFGTIKRSVTIDQDITWGEFVEGSVSEIPVTPSLLAQMQELVADTVALQDSAMAIIDADAGSDFRAQQDARLGKLDAYTGIAETTDDSVGLQAAFDAAVADGFTLVATAGKTYRGKNLDPTGTVCDWRGATLMHPDTPGVDAGNLFEPTGGFRTIGGTFDGNKANTNHPASNGNGNVVSIEDAAGWSGLIRMDGSPTFRNCHNNGVYCIGDRDILDAEDAPYGALLIESPLVHDCDNVGIYLLGFEGATVLNPECHTNGAQGVYINRMLAPRITGVFCHHNGDAGFTSVHCADEVVDGISNDNDAEGFVWGGADPSGTYAIGRRQCLGKLEAMRNGTHGITFDPTVTGMSSILQRIDAKAEQVVSCDNGSSGVQITNAESLHLGAVTADRNGAHGISGTGNKVTFTVAHVRDNVQSGVAEFGTTSSHGGNIYGIIDSTGNGGTNDGVFFAATGLGTRQPSKFVVTQEGGSAATAVPTPNPQPSDQLLIGWAYDPVAVATGSTAPTGGLANVVAVPIRTADTITNILLHIVTAGATLTSGQCFAALYQGGVLLGVTADQATAWQSTGLKTMALTAPADVDAGIVHVMFWANGTTRPAFARTSNLPTLVNAGLGTNASRFGTADTGLTTTAPNPLGTITAREVAYWAGLS